MPKLTLYNGSIFLAIILLSVVYQSATGQYKLNIIGVDRDSAAIHQVVIIQNNFRSKLSCEQYVNNLQGLLQSKGFPTASIDSIQADSISTLLYLYLGERLKLGNINTGTIENRLLEAAGWKTGSFEGKPLTLEKLQQVQTAMLLYMENNGYPFAKVHIDSISFVKDRFYGRLQLEKGPFYKIDSIRVYGDVKIANSFLQRYLEIQNGSFYRKDKLLDISRKIRELPYLQEQQGWNMTMLGTGSILNLYLKSRKSSQVNVLVGLLPANQQTINNKVLLTGEANINLRNALGNGESIGVNWQQIQVKSPRLNLSYQQPYLFGSAFGISTSFDLFKKDSSFVNISLLLGLQYMLSAKKTGRVFIQNLKTNILSIDTAVVKATRRLPSEIDVSSVNLGVDYEYNNTNFRFNPKSGSELQLTITAGTRTLRRSNAILKLSAPDFNYAALYDTLKLKTYQFRSKLSAARYFPLGRQSTIKMGFNGGWFQSPSIFRNELFQIGGYKLLRGFDEESIFASHYAVATSEYRYLIGLNSYLFAFIDAGWVGNKSNNQQLKNNFLGGGIGMAFETKAGIFNISYAAGKRNDLKFNLRQSKIHLGYINYF